MSKIHPLETLSQTLFNQGAADMRAKAPPSRSTCACGSTSGVSPKLPDWYSNPYELGVICEDCVDDMIELEWTKEYF
jgi:hypothetical protein